MHDHDIQVSVRLILASENGACIVGAFPLFWPKMQPKHASALRTFQNRLDTQLSRPLYESKVPELSCLNSAGSDYKALLSFLALLID